jgi:blocked-early-in-transport protein 1
MSDAYERERQNNSRLAELSSKVSALRGVTVDIYDNARAQDVIDNTVCPISLLSISPSSILCLKIESQEKEADRKPPSQIHSLQCPPP